MLLAKYAHKQEDVDKIRRQTQAVFSDMLVQKGLQRVCFNMHAWRELECENLQYYVPPQVN